MEAPSRTDPKQTPRGGGRPLSDATRAFFEPRFGHDFSKVRVHADAGAASAAEALRASAFTSGLDIVFGAGRYAPHTGAGQRLLAHELAHVVQQENSRAAALVQLQPLEPPTKLVTNKVDDVSYPKDDEATLDKRVKARQEQEGPEGKKSKYLGNVSYKNLPPPEKKSKTNKDPDLVRRAMKHALLEVIIVDIKERSGRELRVRVPLDYTEVEVSSMDREYAMIVLRFDKQRNVEVEYAGKNVQSARPPVAGHTLSDLASDFAVTFVHDSITATMEGDKKPSTFAGKEWSDSDVALLKEALPLLGSTEKANIKGSKFRRLAVDQAGNAAGFHSTADNSINLTNSALPVDKALWFGEGGKFYSRAVHTVLHEVGHALHYTKVTPAGKKGTTERLELFKKAVNEESRKRAKKSPGSAFPPPGITLPTDYAAKSWKEFFADSYSIYKTNPSFLGTPEFKYLLDFFNEQFP